LHRASTGTYLQKWIPTAIRSSSPSAPPLTRYDPCQRALADASGQKNPQKETRNEDDAALTPLPLKILLSKTLPAKMLPFNTLPLKAMKTLPSKTLPLKATKTLPSSAHVSAGSVLDASTEPSAADAAAAPHRVVSDGYPVTWSLHPLRRQRRQQDLPRRINHRRKRGQSRSGDTARRWTSRWWRITTAWASGLIPGDQ